MKTLKTNLRITLAVVALAVAGTAPAADLQQEYGLLRPVIYSIARTPNEFMAAPATHIIVDTALSTSTPAEAIKLLDKFLSQGAKAGQAEYALCADLNIARNALACVVSAPNSMTKDAELSRLVALLTAQGVADARKTAFDLVVAHEFGHIIQRANTAGVYKDHLTPGLRAEDVRKEEMIADLLAVYLTQRADLSAANLLDALFQWRQAIVLDAIHDTLPILKKVNLADFALTPVEFLRVAYRLAYQTHNDLVQQQEEGAKQAREACAAAHKAGKSCK